MNKHLIYATSNPGKIIEISRHFGFHDIKVESLSDFIQIVLDPDETGTTLGENAIIKATAYAQAIVNDHSLRGSRFIIVADDTGVEISGLNGEPGIRVRRWKGHKMSDEEIITYTLERLQGMTGEQRTALFRTVLSIVTVSEDGTIGTPVNVTGTLSGRIREVAATSRINGFPFESLFEAKDYGYMLLGDLHRLPESEKRTGKFNHRERAIEQAIPIIRELMK